MYLLDSNIFLELFLDQDKADEVERFLRSIPGEKIFISEFSIYSIGIVLFHHKMFDTYLRFIDDVIITGGIQSITLPPQDVKLLPKIAQKFNLDFDDAYQYTVAEKYDLKIISFDSDFDRTERGRITPDKI